MKGLGEISLYLGVVLSILVVLFIYYPDTFIGALIGTGICLVMGFFLVKKSHT